MRIMKLSELLTELRSEARISHNPAHGVHALDNHRRLLRRIQEELYDAYDWPALKQTRGVTVPAGTRYHTYPEGVGYSGIEKVYVRDQAKILRLLEYGIEPDHFNQYDSDNDQRGFPTRRWQNYFSPDAEKTHQNMFELWPIPDREAGIRFYGKRALFPLTEDGHTSTLDGPLIVLHAAAEILAGQKAEDAALKLQKAQDRLRMLKLRNAKTDNRQINMAGPRKGRHPRPGIDYIPG